MTGPECTAERHGTRYAYSRLRCRCPEALQAESDYRKKLWAQKVRVDPVAVERAVDGDPVWLNTSERQAAVEILTARGLSARRVAGILRVTRRTVVRRRARARELA